jgi:hypothetical protein
MVLKTKRRKTRERQKGGIGRKKKGLRKEENKEERE